MKECPGCGADLPASAVRCSACGSAWTADGTFVPGAQTSAAAGPRGFGGRDGRDTRHYEWVGDAAYTDAAAGTDFFPLVALWFVGGCIAAAARAVRETFFSRSKKGD